jgi:hypothetical protein
VSAVRRARDLVLAVLLACVCVFPPAAAEATQSVKLGATLTPEHLGRGTTIGFSFQIGAPAGAIPAPLTGINLSYPENLGVATSGLGLATCSAARIEAFGPNHCPADSVMGTGNAIAEFPAGLEIVHESAPMSIFRAPEENGQIALLLYVTAANPVGVQIALPSLLLPAAAPFGGSVQIGVPLVPSFPDAPDVAIVQLTATLGPLGITYYERVHGHTIAYHPQGVLLPNSCPRGGFPFAAELGFVDGSTASARTVVPCPGHVK